MSILSRRYFLKALGLLGAATQLPDVKVAEEPAKPSLPVVKFNDKGMVANYLEVMNGVPFVEWPTDLFDRPPHQEGERSWRREREVWVEEVHAVRHYDTKRHTSDGHRYWGKMLLKENLEWSPLHWSEINRGPVVFHEFHTTAESIVKVKANRRDVFSKDDIAHLILYQALAQTGIA